MSSFRGFAELRVPRDFVKKLEYDLARVPKSPQDQYAAFDFFVTAEHIVDWIHPDDQKASKAVRSSSSLLRVISHLANGVKHFEAKAASHHSVASVEKSRYAEAGYVEEGYFEEPLMVDLTTEEKSALVKAASRWPFSQNRCMSIGNQMHRRHNTAVERICANISVWRPRLIFLFSH